MYSNNIVNFQESTTILNACKKKVWKLIEGTTYIFADLSAEQNVTYGYFLKSGFNKFEFRVFLPLD